MVYSNSHALFGVRFDDGEKGHGKAKSNTDRLTPSSPSFGPLLTPLKQISFSA